jgi:REP element-mobilizing transposase RayT
MNSSADTENTLKRVSTRFVYQTPNSFGGIIQRDYSTAGGAMSFWRLYYHLVWTTKERQPLIVPEIEERLLGYLIRKAAELGVYVYAINSVLDHVHLIVAIPPALAVADVVKNLKGASSHHLNHSVSLEFLFEWQRGYGALSLGERQRAGAEEYVRQQKRHHQQQTVNAWLERADEFDEGPADTGMVLDGVLPALREERTPYEVLGEPPF